MKALVTGGTGFVGCHLVRSLLARGAEVRCLVRPASRLDNLEGLDVEVWGEREEWIQVRLPNGVSGWVPRGAVEVV